MTTSDSSPVDPPSGNQTIGGSRGWLHWGLIVVGLYLLALLAITMPLLFVTFPKDFKSLTVPWEVFIQPAYLGLVAVICLSQFLLLRVPVRLATQRPVSRAAVWLPIWVAAFWMGCLILGATCTLVELFELNVALPLALILVPLLGWIVWGIVFARISRAASPREAVNQQSKWMLKGSILELLIAVPSHVFVRQRTDCCAGFMTFIGITMGVSVMLLSFGPAVFFLYYARCQRLRPKA